MVHKAKLALTALVILGGGIADAAFALACTGFVKPKAEFVGKVTKNGELFTPGNAREHAEFVFDARIEKVTDSKELALASVVKTYKQKLPKKVLLSFSKVAGDCGIALAPGQLWLIFAYRRPDTMEVDQVFSFHKPGPLAADFWTLVPKNRLPLAPGYPYYRDALGPPRSSAANPNREQERRYFMKTLADQPFFKRKRVIQAKLGGKYHVLHPDTSTNKECDPLEDRPADVFLTLKPTGRDSKGRFRYRVQDIQSMQSKYAESVALCLSTETITVHAAEPLKSQLVILETKIVLSPPAEFCRGPGQCLPVTPMSGF